jgi:hypothetical protein
MIQEGNAAAGEIKGAKSVEERADEDAGSKGPANGMPRFMTQIGSMACARVQLSCGRCAVYLNIKHYEV